MPSVSTLPHPASATPGTVRVASIAGTGSFQPEGVITNADLETLVDTSNTWILERTGIAQRHRAGAGVTTSMMAAAAGRRALEASGVGSVDAIIVATCTPDTFVPSTACLVQRLLGVPGIPAFDINAACSGFVYGLAIADSMVRQGVFTNLLAVR